MAESAFMIQYRQEFIAGFENTQALLRDTVTTEAVIKGNQATFLVADSGGATAKTRGLNGLIPARADDLDQPVATLTEQHDLVRKTGFNIFASQGDQRAIMQYTSMGVINRKADDQIIDELSNGTLDTGAAATASMNMIIKAKTGLGNNAVPFDGNIYAAITPAFEGYLYQIKEFNNVQYVDVKPVPGADPAYANRVKMFRWLGVNWIVHPLLPGVGTASETCFMYHRSAIGHAIDTAGIQAVVDYEREHDYSYARTTAYMGAKLLQNTGVVRMIHDASGLTVS